MASRLSSDNEDVHKSAFFELVLHELMTRKRFELVAVEAEAPGVSSRPDFLFRDSEHRDLFVEAALVTGRSQKTSRKESERDRVLGALYAVRHPRFRFHVKRVTVGANTVGERAIQRAVVSRLDQLAGEMSESEQAIRRPLEIDIKGVRLTLKAVERRLGDSSDSPGVVSVSYGLQAVRAGAAIRSTLLRKASKYGDALGRPLFIGINSTQLIQRDEDFEAAVFGTLQYAWSDDDDELEPSRKRDGALLEGDRPRYARVSGVLCFHNLTPWNLGKAKARVLENPFAERPYDLQALGLPITRACGEELVTLEGQTLAELLELPEGWPGD